MFYKNISNSSNSLLHFFLLDLRSMVQQRQTIEHLTKKTVLRHQAVLSDERIPGYKDSVAIILALGKQDMHLESRSICPTLVDLWICLRWMSTMNLLDRLGDSDKETSV